MFLICFIAYMDRVNLSVSAPTIMGEFKFSKVEIGWFQSAFFLSYAIMQVPGGVLAEYFGHRRVLVACILWWSVFTSLTAACGGVESFLSVRFLFGLGEGPMLAAMSYFVYRWYNTSERSLAAACLPGGCFIGPAIGPPVVVALLLALGWRWVFLLFGIVGAGAAILWYLFATPTPKESRHVNQAELAFIQSGTVQAKTAKDVAPWRRFLKSPQFWALGAQYFLTDYIMYVYLAWLPLYLVESQGFSLAKMGMAASFPWLALCAVTMLSGRVSDRLIAAGASKYQMRTLLGAVGLAVCCGTLYLGATSGDPTMTVVWLTVALGALGMTFCASWVVCLDLGGRYSGSVSGWMNFWGNVGGIVAPMVTAWIATVYGWQAALVFTAVMGLLGVVAWFLVRPDHPLVDDVVVTTTEAVAAE
jgi:ACS family glucarate transporter-like MFS transporter